MSQSPSSTRPSRRDLLGPRTLTSTLTLSLITIFVCASLVRGSDMATQPKPRPSCFNCTDCPDPFGVNSTSYARRVLCSENDAFCYKVTLPDGKINRGCSQREECPKDSKQTGVTRCSTCDNDLCNSASFLHGSVLVQAVLAMTFGLCVLFGI